MPRILSYFGPFLCLVFGVHYIGEEYHLVQNVYDEDEHEYSKETDEKNVDQIHNINGLYYVYTQQPGKAHFEMLRLKRHVLPKLHALVQQLTKRENTLKETLFIGMTCLTFYDHAK